MIIRMPFCLQILERPATDLGVQEDEGNDDLDGQAPELMQPGTQAHHAVGVNRCKGLDLATGECCCIGHAQSQGLAVGRAGQPHPQLATQPGNAPGVLRIQHCLWNRH